MREARRRYIVASRVADGVLATSTKMPAYMATPCLQGLLDASRSCKESLPLNWSVRGAIVVSVLLLATDPSAAVQASDDETGEPATAEVPYDRAGLRRDTAYFLGYEFVAVGVISLWPQDDTSYSNKLGFDRWLNNVTHPHWDTDGAFVNLVLHPYWGASYYVRGRERGLERGQAFWYSALLSSIFEFGAEAMVEQVSYQDLIFTPVLGSLLGEYVFMPLRAHIRAKEGPLDTIDRIALVLTDPLGAINSAVGRTLGVETQLSLRPMVVDGGSGHRLAAAGAARPSAPKRVGWRLQLDIVW